MPSLLTGQERTTGFSLPSYLIPRVLKHMEHGGEIGTLVILLWTSAAWWPLITTDGTQPAEFVRDWAEIPPTEDVSPSHVRLLCFQWNPKLSCSCPAGLFFKFIRSRR